MAKSSDIIKIGFDYRASLEQFVKETNGVFDGISEKAGKQRISIQLDAKNDKVIEKIKELQKLKLDKFTFEFGESGLAEQLKTFDQLEKKITEIINLSKGIDIPTINLDTNIHALQQEEAELKKVTDSYEKLLDLKHKIKNVNKSSYSGKHNTDWIGIYSSQEEAITNELADNKQKLHSSINLILSEDKNALSALEEEANRLKTALQSVQDMASRISSNSSIAYLDENKGSENWYKGYAEAYKAIDDRLSELNRQYSLTNEELEEYITLQVKAEKIMDNMAAHNGGVKGSGAKNKYELKQWIEKSFARDLGLNPEDIYDGLFGNISDALYDGNGISLFDAEGTKRSLREVSAEILKYKSATSVFDGAFGANEDAERLREISSVLTYIKKNMSEIESTDFSAQIKQATDNVEYFSKKLAEGEHTDFYSETLETAQKELQELIELQERLNVTKRQDTDVIQTPTSNAVEQLEKQEQQALATAQAEEKLAETEKNLAKSTSTVDDSKFDELKADVTEIREELNGVKEKISAIDSEGFEHVKADVEKTVESVKELNNELTEMKSKLDSASTSPVETNISLGNSDPFNEMGQYKKISESTVDVLVDIGKSEDEILSKLKAEKELAEANNEIWKERLILLDSAGKVVASHRGSTDLITGINGVARLSQEELDKAKGGKIIHTHPNKASFFSPSDYKDMIMDGMSEQIKTVELMWKDSTLSVDKSSMTKQTSSTLYNIIRNVSKTLTDIYTDNPGGTPSLEAREHINAIQKEIFKVVAQKLNISVSETGEQSKAVVDALSDVDKAIIQKFKGIEASVIQDINPSEIISSISIKDTFQGDKIEQATTSAKELDKALEQAVNIPTDDFDEILSKLDLTKSKLGEIVKITKQGHAGEDGKFIESFVLKDKNGSSETYGASSSTEKGQLLRYNYVEKNTEAINKQKNAEKELQSQRDNFNKKNLNAIDMEIKKREEESSAYAKTLKSQMEERYNAISSMEKSLDNYNSKLEKFSVKPADGHRYPVYQQQIDNLTKKISELDTLKNNLSKKDIIDESDIKSVNALQQEIDELILKMNNMSAGERGFDPLGADKALEKIYNELQKNSGMSKEAKRQIQGYYDEIRSGNPSKPIKDLLDDMYKLIQLEREAGRAHKSFKDIFKEKVVYGAAANMAGMIGIYDVINVGRQAVDIVIDLNTQITELAKVSEATSSQIYDDFNSYAEIAKEVGGTISDTISATADWSRNGYNIPDSKELAEVAMIYKNVGDGISIDQANEYLISTLRGFSLEAEDAMSVIDSINEVANNEPISASGIGEALQRSAAAFNAANTSLQESIALTSATNSVLQSPEKVGSMWTTVSARIRGAKTELEEAGLETDGMVESTSKLQAMIKGMTGFDILESDGKTFKSIYDIIVGIGDEFQKLDDIDQAALLEALAGKRQSNALAAALNNIDILKKSYQEAMNAEGSAMEEQRKYQESVQYSIDRAKASLEELANDFLSSDFLKGLIDSGDKLINILDWIIDKFGVLGAAVTVGGGILGAKNVGKRRSTMFHNCFEYADRDRCFLYKIGFLSPIVKYTLVNEATISVEII